MGRDAVKWNWMGASFCVGFPPFSQIDRDFKEKKVTEKGSIEGGVRREWEVNVPEGEHNQSLKAAGQIPGWVPGVLSAALLNIPSIPAEKGGEEGGRTLVQRGCGCSSPGSVQARLNRALSNLVWGWHPYPWQGLGWDDQWGHSNPNHSGIIWFQGWKQRPYYRVWSNILGLPGMQTREKLGIMIYWISIFKNIKKKKK